MSNQTSRCLGCSSELDNGDLQFCKQCKRNNDKRFNIHTKAYDIDRIRIIYCTAWAIGFMIIGLVGEII